MAKKAPHASKQAAKKTPKQAQKPSPLEFLGFGMFLISFPIIGFVDFWVGVSMLNVSSLLIIATWFINRRRKKQQQS